MKRFLLEHESEYGSQVDDTAAVNDHTEPFYEESSNGKISAHGGVDLKQPDSALPLAVLKHEDASPNDASARNMLAQLKSEHDQLVNEQGDAQTDGRKLQDNSEGILPTLQDSYPEDPSHLNAFQDYSSSYVICEGSFVLAVASYISDVEDEFTLKQGDEFQVSTIWRDDWAVGWRIVDTAGKQLHTALEIVSRIRPDACKAFPTTHVRTSTDAAREKEGSEYIRDRDFKCSSDISNMQRDISKRLHISREEIDRRIRISREQHLAVPSTVIAIYVYRSALPDDLELSEGQKITVTDVADDHWYSGYYPYQRRWEES